MDDYKDDFDTILNIELKLNKQNPSKIDAENIRFLRNINKEEEYKFFCEELVKNYSQSNAPELLRILRCLRIKIPIPKTLKSLKKLVELLTDQSLDGEKTQSVPERQIIALLVDALSIETEWPFEDQIDHNTFIVEAAATLANYAYISDYFIRYMISVDLIVIILNSFEIYLGDSLVQIFRLLHNIICCNETFGQFEYQEAFANIISKYLCYDDDVVVDYCGGFALILASKKDILLPETAGILVSAFIDAFDREKLTAWSYCADGIAFIIDTAFTAQEPFSEMFEDFDISLINAARSVLVNGYECDDVDRIGGGLRLYTAIFKYLSDEFVASALASMPFSFITSLVNGGGEAELLAANLCIAMAPRPGAAEALARFDIPQLLAVASDSAVFATRKAALRALIEVLKEAPPEAIADILAGDILVLLVEGLQGNVDPEDVTDLVNILTVLADNDMTFAERMIEFDGFDILDDLDRELDEDGILDAFLDRFRA